MKLFVACPRGRTFDSFFDDRNIELAQQLFDVVWNPFDRNMTAEEAASLAVGCDVYMTSWGAPVPDNSFFEAAPHLQVVAHLGAHTEHIETEKLAERGVRILSGEDHYHRSAAEGALAYILSALRCIPDFSFQLKHKGEWKHKWDRGRGLVGKTVGVFNYSRAGSYLTQLLVPFGVKILVYDREKIPKTELRKKQMMQVSGEILFASSDIICVYPPTVGEHYHMIDYDLLSLVKDGALLVDISTGGVIDREALIGILLRRKIFAVLDVYEKEPPDRDDPLILLQNVLPMPHMAGPTPDVRRVVVNDLLTRSAQMCISNVKDQRL